MDTITIRIALGDRMHVPGRSLTIGDVFELTNVSDAMDRRSVDVSQDVFERKGWIESWVVQKNPQQENRLELVITIKLHSGL